MKRHAYRWTFRGDGYEGRIARLENVTHLPWKWEVCCLDSHGVAREVPIAHGREVDEDSANSCIMIAVNLALAFEKGLRMIGGKAWGE